MQRLAAQALRRRSEALLTASRTVSSCARINERLLTGASVSAVLDVVEDTFHLTHVHAATALRKLAVLRRCAAAGAASRVPLRAPGSG
jgi:hypothetical protein